MPLILPNSHLKAQAENAPSQFQSWLKHGYGDWRGDESLTFWLDPQGEGWEILQNTPGDGWRTVYSSLPGEKITVRIFEHLARNSPEQALKQFDAAIKRAEKATKDRETRAQEGFEETARKIEFYIRQAH